MVSSVQTQPRCAFRHAQVSQVVGRPVLVVRTTAEFIPFDAFRSMFQRVGEIIKQEKITCLIFDKRSLRVFDPESMEWYFTRWKEEFYDHGLRTHFKIMPEDVPFKYSVDTARNRIFEQHPRAKFHRMTIRYVASVEEALGGIVLV